VSVKLIEEGLALWLPNKDEYLWNREYAAAAKRAADSRLGLWSSMACGEGPNQDAQLKVKVKWAGRERVTIRNLGDTEINLSGWWIRDSSYHGGRRAHGYTFPQNTTIPAHGKIFVIPAKVQKAPDGNRYYWHLPSGHVFDDLKTGRTGMGDGAYLFDPDGDLRAARQYAPDAAGKIRFP
jgi:hypothetical protein